MRTHSLLLTEIGCHFHYYYVTRSMVGGGIQQCFDLSDRLSVPCILGLCLLYRMRQKKHPPTKISLFSE